eukprot:CAMPEP_0116063600 /NCGR_PEP_ID=MMETSP0322-20121206/8527_1 /TAXON_ID=163516 /ORGANISM="Leptocylindrus danicus var. apora, Strain B651" /LENGTH=57 /DNA_ID=CAMNT_0003549281 /DNA_START=759 /DNA_END=932 /DNA_ORIENTATION=+
MPSLQPSTNPMKLGRNEGKVEGPCEDFELGVMEGSVSIVATRCGIYTTALSLRLILV